MSEDRFQQPPELKKELPLSLTTGIIFMVIVLLALPISQMISEVNTRGRTQVDVVEMRPPPMHDQPPPPVEEDKPEEIERIEERREPPTLQQLEIAMNPDLAGLGSSDFTVPTIDVGTQISEMIFELSDLTRAPEPTFQPRPNYPPAERRAGIQGSVRLEFVVRSDGTTSNIVALRSDNPNFTEAAIRAVRRWRFNPGEKDGQAVNARVRIDIPFTTR